MVIEEWVKLAVQAQRSYVIFWATMFMTSTLGIVRILSDYHDARTKYWYFTVFTLLYFFFVGLSALSVNGGLNAYRLLREYSIDGKLGDEIRKQAIQDPTILDRVLSVPGGYMKEWMIYMPLAPVIFYLTLFFLALMQI